MDAKEKIIKLANINRYVEDNFDKEQLRMMLVTILEQQNSDYDMMLKFFEIMNEKLNK